LEPLRLDGLTIILSEGQLLVAGSGLVGEPHLLPQRSTTWAAAGYLVVVGSVVVFVLYLVVLRYWAASRRRTRSCSSRA
jgi:drug/metabolite transporter (DMT)-like permease